MSFWTGLRDIVTGQTGIDITEKAADETGINDGLEDLGVNKIGSIEGMFDPLDFAGVGGKKKEEAAIAEAEAEQLAALDTAQKELRRSTGIAQDFLQPYANVGTQGVDQSAFLTDPNLQAEFLRDNPLYDLGLENLNEQTGRSAAATGRLSSGDTLDQLQQNAALAGQPLIADQKSSIVDLLNFGSGTSRSQANAALGLGSDIAGLITDAGNVTSAATAAEAAASAQQQANNQKLALTIASAFSDPALKENKKVTGKKNGFTLWVWDWNEKAKALGLVGSSAGVMADEVLSKMPKAISYDRGYMKVNYEMVGV